MLYALKSAKPKLRKAILQNASPELIKTLSEIVYSVIHGNVEICSVTHKKLRKYKKSLRKFAVPHYSIERKRRLIVNQRGGWISPLMTIVGALLSKLL